MSPFLLPSGGRGGGGGGGGQLGLNDLVGVLFLQLGLNDLVGVLFLHVVFYDNYM